MGHSTLPVVQRTPWWRAACCTRGSCCSQCRQVGEHIGRPCSVPRNSCLSHYTHTRRPTNFITDVSGIMLAGTNRGLLFHSLRSGVVRSGDRVVCQPGLNGPIRCMVLTLEARVSAGSGSAHGRRAGVRVVWEEGAVRPLCRTFHRVTILLRAQSLACTFPWSAAGTAAMQLQMFCSAWRVHCTSWAWCNALQ